MQRFFTLMRVALLALTSIFLLSCAGGSPTAPRTNNQLSLGIEFRPLAVTQTSPIIPLTVEIAPTGASSPIQVYIRMVYRLPAEGSEFFRMSAAPGSRNLNATGVTTAVPPEGTTVEFLWDAFADLGESALEELVILRAGVLDATAEDPREALCTVEPNIEVTFTDDDGDNQIAECGIAPQLEGGTLPIAFRGRLYDEPIPFTGGLQTPLTWTIIDPNNGNDLGQGVGNGLTLTDEGRITGIVAEDAPNSVNFLVRVSDSCSLVRNGNREAAQLNVTPGDQFDQASFTVNFSDPGVILCPEPLPSFETESLPTATLGSPYEFQVNAVFGTGGLSYSADGLPAELTIDAAGLITGIPGEIGTFPITITATDNCAEGARSADVTLDLEVVDAPCPVLTINNISIPQGDVGVPYSLTFTATGGEGDLSWNATGLPEGLSLSADGVLSGTPAEDGTFPVSISVTDNCDNPEPQVDTADINLTINPEPCGDPPSFFSQNCADSQSPCVLPDAVFGELYSQMITVTVPNGMGMGELVPGSQLPDGLTLDVQNNDTTVDVTLAGSPTDPLDVGTAFNFTLRAEDMCPQGPQSTQNTYTVTVVAGASCEEPEPVIFFEESMDTLPNGSTGTPYSATLTVQGGTPTVGAIQILETDAPGELLVDSDGRTLIGGFGAGDEGEYQVILSVTDSCEVGAGPRTAIQEFSLTVDAVVCDPLSITTDTLPDAPIGQSYEVAIEAEGGFGQLIYMLGGEGMLPPGISLDSTGVLVGTSEGPAGDYNFTVTAADQCPAGQQTTNAPFTITVPAVGECGAAPEITTDALDPALNGEEYTFTLEGSGSELPLTWSLNVESGPLPLGLDLSTDGVISGTPGDFAGQYPLTIDLSDSCAQGPQTDTVELTLDLTDPVVCDPIIASLDELGDPVFGEEFSGVTILSGGEGQLTVELFESTLPSGIMVDNLGVFTGIPDNVEDVGVPFNFTLRITDECADPEPQIQDVMGTITVQPAPCPLPMILTEEVPNATFGSFYEFTFEADGLGPFTFEVFDDLPSGLVLDPSGVLSGTPDDDAEIGQNFEFELFATDSCNNPEPQQTSSPFAITINPVSSCPALTISTTDIPSVETGDPYVVQLESDGGEGQIIWALAPESTLPEELILEANGEISGLVSADAGDYVFTVVAIDDCRDPEPQVAMQELTLTVTEPLCPPLSITTITLPDVFIGQEYDGVIEATGGFAPNGFSIADGDLPEGLELNADGTITGLVDNFELFGQTFVFTALVMDQCPDPEPQTDSRQLSVRVTAPPCADFDIEFNPEPFEIENGSSVDIQLGLAAPGEPPVLWAQSPDSEPLPNGLEITSDGRIFGDVNDQPGNYLIRVDAIDNCIFGARVDTERFFISLTGVCQPIAFDLDGIGNPTLGAPYLQQFPILGGVAPYSYVLDEGELPTGITFDEELGELSGIVTNPGEIGGEFFVTLTVTDSCTAEGGPAMFTDTFDFTVDPPICDDLSITTTDIPDAIANQTYEFQLESTGGFGRISWSADEGSVLPDGLDLDNTGLLSGLTTDLPGTYTLIAVATDECIPEPQIVSETFTFDVTVTCDPIGIATEELPQATNGEEYFAQLEGFGQGGLTWSEGPQSILPSGLTINADGTITGTPDDVPGIFDVEVVVTDSCIPAQTDSTTLVLELLPAACIPVQIATEALPDPTFATGYSEFIEVNGGEGDLLFELVDSLLPSGLDLNGETGEISGSPDNPQEIGRPVTFTVMVTDSCANPEPSTDAMEYTLTVQPFVCDPLLITTTELDPATPGEEYFFQLQGAGGQQPFTWAEGQNSELPEGLTINTDGTITGTTEAEPGDYDVEVILGDSCPGIPQQTSADFVLTVLGPGCPPFMIDTTDIPDPVFGEAYSQFITTAGGVPPVAWDTGGGDLPSGLDFDVEAGEIFGTPDNVEDIGQEFTFEILAVDSCPDGAQQDLQEYTVTVQAPACDELIITTEALDDATVGVFYNFRLDSFGGFGQVSWANGEQSNLPEGLTVNPDGTITGTTTVDPGDYFVSVDATDQCPSGAQTTTGEFTLTVLANCPPLDITTLNLPDPVFGEAYSQFIQTSGGVPPIDFDTGAGNLPDGLDFDVESGEIFGTPNNVEDINQEFTFEILAVDSCTIPGNQQDTQEYTVTVQAPTCDDLVITTEGLDDATQGVEYAFQLESLGGFGDILWMEGPDSSLPGGLTINADGSITGATNDDAGDYQVIVQAMDNCPTGMQVTTETFTLTVLAGCDPLSIITSALPNGTVSEDYFVQLMASGGEGRVTWTVQDGDVLPDGLNLDPTGILGGQPSLAGEFTFTLIAQDECPTGPQQDSREYTVTIDPFECDELIVETTELPDGIATVQYDFQLVASGEGELTFINDNPEALPQGYTLSPTGLLSGRTSEFGNFSLVATVRDSCEPPQEISGVLPLRINPPPCPTLSITTVSLPIGTTTVPYSFQLESAGGIGTILWSVDQQTPLPEGLQLRGDGLLTGIPEEAGEGTVRVIARDECPSGVQQAERDLFLQINEFVCDTLTLDTEAVPEGTVGTAYNFQFEASGGTGQLIWTFKRRHAAAARHRSVAGRACYRRADSGRRVHLGNHRPRSVSDRRPDGHGELHLYDQ